MPHSNTYIVETSGGEFEVGPQSELAQVWSPPWLVTAFWDGMRAAGWDALPRSARAGELAAGVGRLIEAQRDRVQWVLNEIDPRLVAELRGRFPAADVHVSDFRTLRLTRPLDALVGTPPWIHEGLDYLPSSYLDAAVRLVRSGGLVGVIVPTWLRRAPAELAPLLRRNVTVPPDWPFPNRPACWYLRRR